VRRPEIFFCVAIVACGARTDLGGAYRLGTRDAGDSGDTGDARPPDAGPPPSPCVATAPIELASGGKEIQFIALDDANVYWTDYALGTVNVVPKAGGAASVIAAARGNPSGLAVNAGTVYWTEFTGDVVASAPTIGGSVATVASNQDGAYDVTASGDDLYWTTFRACTVGSIQDGASKQLDKASQPFSAIVSTGSLVFWVSYETKSVESYDSQSNVHATLVHGGSNLPFTIATDGANVYFGEATTTEMSIGAVPVGGGPTTTIYGTACDDDDGGLVGACLASVATDGSFVYFTAAGSGDATGAVAKVPIGGGEAAVLASGQARPFDVAVDDKCVYWSDLGDGTVWAAPK